MSSSRAPRSLQDKKLQVSIEMKGHSSNLQDVAVELDTQIHNSIDGNCSKNRAIKTSIKIILVPFIKQASSHYSSSAFMVPPIAGLNYIHNRAEANHKRCRPKQYELNKIFSCKTNSKNYQNSALCTFIA